MTVMSTQVAAKAGFVCTASEDGHVKFWKKMQRGVEFVKHFHAHVGPIADVAASFDGLWLATTGDDGAAKLYDVHAFDMACILRTKRDAAEPYVPGAACWLQTASAPTPRVALAAADETAPSACTPRHFALVAKLRVHARPSWRSPAAAARPAVSADRAACSSAGGAPTVRAAGATARAPRCRKCPPRRPATPSRTGASSTRTSTRWPRPAPGPVGSPRPRTGPASPSPPATRPFGSSRRARAVPAPHESAAALDARRGAWLLRRARGAAGRVRRLGRRRSHARARRDGDGRQGGAAAAPAEPEDAALRALVAPDDLSYGRRRSARSRPRRAGGASSRAGTPCSTRRAITCSTGRSSACASTRSTPRGRGRPGAADEAERFGCLALFEGAAKLDAQMEQARGRLRTRRSRGA